jgi:hypothetical protein
MEIDDWRALAQAIRGYNPGASLVFRSKGFGLRYERCLGRLVELGWWCCPRRDGNADFPKKLFLPGRLAQA